MNHYRTTAICVIALCLTKPAFAEYYTDADNKGFWQCVAYDSQHLEWAGTSTYQLTASNKAMDACKKQSHHPATCKVAKESCDAYVHGVNTSPMWQCTALDLMAKPWVSNPHHLRDDAAIAARGLCEQHSAMPDTCYINLMTCKNLNEQT